MLGISDGKYVVERKVHCIALHCIGQNGILKLLDDDEGMEIEVLIDRVTFVCMYVYCTL